MADEIYRIVKEATPLVLREPTCAYDVVMQQIRPKFGVVGTDLLDFVFARNAHDCACGILARTSDFEKHILHPLKVWDEKYIRRRPAALLSLDGAPMPDPTTIGVATLAVGLLAEVFRFNALVAKEISMETGNRIVEVLLGILVGCAGREPSSDKENIVIKTLQALYIFAWSCIRHLSWAAGGEKGVAKWIQQAFAVHVIGNASDTEESWHCFWTVVVKQLCNDVVLLGSPFCQTRRVQIMRDTFPVLNAIARHGDIEHVRVMKMVPDNIGVGSASGHIASVLATTLAQQLWFASQMANQGYSELALDEYVPFVALMEMFSCLFEREILKVKDTRVFVGTTRKTLLQALEIKEDGLDRFLVEFTVAVEKGYLLLASKIGAEIAVYRFVEDISRNKASITSAIKQLREKSRILPAAEDNVTRLGKLFARRWEICHGCNEEVENGKKLSRCGRCFAVNYESTDCQKKDWLAPGGGHKRQCSGIKKTVDLCKEYWFAVRIRR